jgi:hypothetical protein
MFLQVFDTSLHSKSGGDWQRCAFWLVHDSGPGNSERVSALMYSLFTDLTEVQICSGLGFRREDDSLL